MGESGPFAAGPAQTCSTASRPPSAALGDFRRACHTAFKYSHARNAGLRLRTWAQMVLRYLPTSSPWLNLVEMLRPHFQREVTRCELFARHNR